MSEPSFDVIVIGAGMAGASIAAELAASVRVLLVEAEDQPGRHTTGRSAAMYFESYGNAVVRALTRASRRFLLEPPADVADGPLMHRRDALIVAGPDTLPQLEAWHADGAAGHPMWRVSASEALARCPILRPERVVAALVDVSGHDLDVARLHQGWLRRLRRRGGEVALDAGSTSVARTGGVWTVSGRERRWQAPVVVDAAGAWADEVAGRAGVPRVGLQPKRRTAVMLPAPEGLDARAFATWPLVAEASESVYFKPDAGQLLLSPANEDDSPPCDVAPAELDVAIAADRLESLTTMPVRRIARRWAGLRTFAPDRSPVVGFDPHADGFFWFAGQGGYGIQLAPALARAGAALLLGQDLPPDIAAEGVEASSISPARWATPARR